MKKKLSNVVMGGGATFPRFNLRVKFVLLLFLTSLCHLRAGPIDSLKTNIYLDATRSTVLEVIQTIEAETKFKFFYSAEELDLNRMVDIHVNGLKIEETLEKLFLNSKVDFKITLNPQAIIDKNRETL